MAAPDEGRAILLAIDRYKSSALRGDKRQILLELSVS
jgi:hypothetical protein